MKDREPGPPQEKLASLPSSPGVYLFVDGEGDVIYVGKAKQLRRRVRSYFTWSGGGDGRTFFPNIVEETEDLECIVTDNEKEALILENILIKKHRPRYNLVFRDDKSYLKLRLTVRDPFPRLHPVRKVRRDGARYFGPFSSASALRETLALLQTRFPLRNCTDSQFANRSRPCIRHEIRQCSAPCCDRVSRDTYGSMVREAVLFLEGKIPQLVKTLRDRMNREADALRFEEAARLRDASEAVEKTLTEQKVVSYDLQDRDVFGLYREGGDMALAVLFVREGNVVGSTGASYQGFPTDEEALSASIMQFYAAENPPPPTVLVPVELPDAELLAEVLAERRGGAVHLTAPKRGQKRALIAMAGKNASLVLAHSDRSLQRRARAIEDLKEQVGLPRTPHRIECFDVSHITGSWAVGAQVVFQDGAPEPKSYRTYRIRSAQSDDDFAMMREILQRRFAPGKPSPPDLLVVDGGPGQLSSALKVLRQTGLEPFPVVGMAKERRGSAKPDRLHLPGGGDPLVLPERSSALFLLQRIRDEAHRFAVRYHRKLRRARTLRSGLEEIPGVGPKRRARLLAHFGSLKAAREASVEELADVPGIPRAVAEAVAEFLHAPVPDEKGLSSGSDTS